MYILKVQIVLPFLFTTVLMMVPPVSAQGLDDILNGINTVWTSGAPGPLFPITSTPYPLISTDEATSSYPSLVAVATEEGAGRTMAFGHEGFFTDADIVQFDNLDLALNAIAWLDQSGLQSILITSGHSEWLSNATDVLQDELVTLGYNVTNYPGVLDAAALEDVGVLFIGNAWGSFTEGELQAIEAFHDAGGGLFLLGLGWSWPGSLRDYPMNKVGDIGGVQWVQGFITDPDHQHNGTPLFQTFYPDITRPYINILPADTQEAFDNIEDILGGPDVVATVQNNEEIRARFTYALLYLKNLTLDATVPEAELNDLYAFFLDLLDDYPQYLAKGPVYDPATENVMAYRRELIHRTLPDILPLTPQRKTEIAAALNLSGLYLDIWNQFSILLLDNSSLSEEQKTVVLNYMTLIPEGLHNLRSISVKDIIGPGNENIPLNGKEGAVNIFGISVGFCAENGFPSDVAGHLIDCFTVVLAHEVNHNVDFFTIQPTGTALAERRDALIASAGTEPMNYLRSMFDPGFFVNAPQEFFASIANQYFANAERTLELGLTRFDNGFLDPINQLLFFAEVYSEGGSSTWFYTGDTQGEITRQAIPLQRDEQGHINELHLTENVGYHFDLDAEGDVVAYEQIDPTVAVIRYVATTGDDTGNDCTEEANPCATITHASEQANNGDILHIAAGVYNEPLLMTDKALLIQGEGVIVE